MGATVKVRRWLKNLLTHLYFSCILLEEHKDANPSRSKIWRPFLLSCNTLHTPIPHTSITPTLDNHNLNWCPLNMGVAQDIIVLYEVYIEQQNSLTMTYMTKNGPLAMTKTTAVKKRCYSFKLNRVYLDSLNMSNAPGTFPGLEFLRTLPRLFTQSREK